MTALLAVSNPYWGNHFFQFFCTLGKRLFQFFSGQLSFSDLATDEIQLCVLALLAISCSVLGSFLLLRKMMMLANSLSHTVLIGIILAFFVLQKADFHSVHLSTLFVASLISAFLTTFFAEFLTRRLKLQEDASIGLIFTFLFALGILCATILTRSAHIGTEVVMGNVDALHLHDVKLLFLVLLINLAFLSFFFKPLKISTFDPLFAKTLGIASSFFHYLLMVLVALTCVASFRAVGVILVLSFLTAPYLSMRLFCHDLKKILFLSPLWATLSALVGVALSRHLLSVHSMAVSTGSLVVLLMGIQFLLFFAWKKRRAVVQP